MKFQVSKNCPSQGKNHKKALYSSNMDINDSKYKWTVLEYGVVKYGAKPRFSEFPSSKKFYNIEPRSYLYWKVDMLGIELSGVFITWSAWLKSSLRSSFQSLLRSLLKSPIKKLTLQIQTRLFSRRWIEAREVPRLRAPDFRKSLLFLKWKWRMAIEIEWVLSIGIIEWRDWYEY